MSTTTPSANTEHDWVTVTLTDEQADYVREEMLSDATPDTSGVDSDYKSRDEILEATSELQAHLQRLDRLGWESTGTREYEDRADRLARIANQLVEQGTAGSHSVNYRADDPLGQAAEYREWLRPLLAGVAILEQLEVA